MYTIRGFSYSDLVTSGLVSNYFRLSVLVSVDTSLDRSFFDDVLIFEAANGLSILRHLLRALHTTF